MTWTIHRRGDAAAVFLASCARASGARLQSFRTSRSSSRPSEPIHRIRQRHNHGLSAYASTDSPSMHPKSADPA
ncbi:hypothetical protein BDN67DRAFT_67803 [Paxillus ammoniavirescens]|nr:hypothetical protein BDN67DRAFT_67803 [Paxillus ammoniavirescens]